MSNRLISEITADEQKQRQKGDKWLITQVFAKLKNMYDNLWKNVSLAKDDDESRGILETLLKYAARIRLSLDYPGVFDVSIENAITVIPFEDIIPEILNDELKSAEVTIRETVSMPMIQQPLDVEITREIGAATDALLKKWVGKDADVIEPVENVVEEDCQDLKEEVQSKKEDSFKPDEDPLMPGLGSKYRILSDPRTADTISGRRVSPIQVNVECLEGFKGVHRIDGSKGECCYNALIYASGVDTTPSQLRKLFKSSKYYGVVGRIVDTLDDELTEGRWGGAGIIQLFAYHFDVDVCVHDTVKNSCYRFFCGLPTTIVLHLEYSGNHYDVLEVAEFVRAGAVSKYSMSLCDRVEIVEADMTDIYAGAINCVFAHCISSDFDDDRRMSAGVATVFAKLGKPTRSDIWKGSDITVQKFDSNYVVGLMTKPRYFSKPGKKIKGYSGLSYSSYHSAFSDLLSFLKEVGYSTLIVPPAGCVRDRVPVEIFLNCIRDILVKLNVEVKIVIFRDKGRGFEDVKKQLEKSLPEIMVVDDYCESNDDYEDELESADLLGMVHKVEQIVVGERERDCVVDGDVRDIFMGDVSLRFLQDVVDDDGASVVGGAVDYAPLVVVELSDDGVSEILNGEVPLGFLQNDDVVNDDCLDGLLDDSDMRVYDSDVNETIVSELIDEVVVGSESEGNVDGSACAVDGGVVSVSDDTCDVGYSSDSGIVDEDCVDAGQKCFYCDVQKCDVELVSNSRPDTSIKIDSIMQMVDGGGSFCLLGGASKVDDVHVKMHTQYIKKRFKSFYSVDPRFSKTYKSSKFISAKFQDVDLSGYDVVFSDMYFSDQSLCNHLDDLLRMTGDSASLVVKFTWSTVHFSKFHDLLKDRYFKILHTSASGTSSEFFCVIYKGLGLRKSSVDVCTYVNQMWEHVESCKNCRPLKVERSASKSVSVNNLNSFVSMYGCGVKKKGFLSRLFGREKALKVPSNSLVDDVCGDISELETPPEGSCKHVFPPQEPESLCKSLVKDKLSGVMDGPPLNTAFNLLRRTGVVKCNDVREFECGQFDGQFVGTSEDLGKEYVRVVKSRKVRIFGKHVGDVHVGVEKKILSKPDPLDAVLLNEANRYFPIAPATVSESVPVDAEVKCKKPEKREVKRKFEKRQSSSDREFLEETQVVPGMMGFREADMV